MAYQENPNFPVNPAEPIQVNNNQIRDLDLDKVIQALATTNARLQDIENALSPGPGSQTQVREIQQFSLGPGVTAIGFECNTFSLANLQGPDTDTISLQLNTQAGLASIDIEPGSIYNFPGDPNFKIEVLQADNQGADVKQIQLIRYL